MARKSNILMILYETQDQFQIRVLEKVSNPRGSGSTTLQRRAFRFFKSRIELEGNK
jgi:hypothetical protein